MEKGIDANPPPVCGRVQSPGVHCRKMWCSTVPKTDRPTHHRSDSAYKRSAHVSPVSRYGNDSQQRSIGLVLAN